MIRQLCVFLALLVLLARPVLGDDGLLAEGRRLYLEGQRADGSPLEGWRPGGERLRGRDMACVQCHRRSGMGTVEGVVIVPPVAGLGLFSPGRPASGHVPRRAAGMTLQDHAFRTRPAYDGASLGRALREGIGAGGVPFEPLMPRYTLSDREIAALSAWMRSLGSTPAPGVDDAASGGTLHLATVIAPDADPRQRDAMRAVLQHCVAQRSPQPGSGRQPWQLDEWQLEGPQEGWRAQLAEHMRSQPAFALLAGVGREWQPIHDFCEAEGVPCLFPNTDAAGPAPYASIYLWPGVALEGAVMARQLAEQARPPRRVVQVFAQRDIGRFGAAALTAALPGVKQLDAGFAGSLDESRARKLLASLKAGDALVLWLAPADLRRFFAARPTPPAGISVLLSGTLAELDRASDGALIPPAWRPALRFTYPFELPDERLARMVFNLGGWMSGHGLALARDTERIQGNTYSACEVTARALYTMAGRHSRDYLLELVEDSYAGAVATAFPRFTLGPGQRFGSKGAYWMRVGSSGRLEVDGDWIVP